LNDATGNQETTMNALTTSTTSSNLITTAIFGALALMGGASTMAASGDEVRQVVVRFGDLNLSNPQGAAALYRRISIAAAEVCGAFDVSVRDRELGYRAGTTTCVRTAISGAVTKVGRPELFAIYNAKNSAPLGVHVAAARVH
jgi:UrcA family protein